MRLNHSANTGLIECNLSVFPLADLPSYTALSYCWTDAAPSCCILLNGRLFSVRPNLYAYLKIMRNERQTCWIFIDALCIDQRDNAERGHFVQLMGQVYREAEEVVTWLGEPKLTDVVELIVFNIAQELLDIGLPISEALERLRNAPMVVAVIIKSLLDNEYWARSWIVQEFILARNLVVRAGKFRTTGEKLAAVLEYADNTVSLISREFGRSRVALDSVVFMAFCFKRESLSERFSVASRLIQARREWSSSEHGFPALSDLIITYSAQNCSNPHDKVFGLLGLTATQLHVSYQMSLLELFLRTFIETAIDGIRAGQLKDVENGNLEHQVLLMHTLLHQFCLSIFDPVVVITVYTVLAAVINRFSSNAASRWYLSMLRKIDVAPRRYLSLLWEMSLSLALESTIGSDLRARFGSFLLAPIKSSPVHWLISGAMGLKVGWYIWRGVMLLPPEKLGHPRTMEQWSLWASDLVAEVADTGQMNLERQYQCEMARCENLLSQLEKKSMSAENHEHTEFFEAQMRFFQRAQQLHESLDDRVLERGAAIMICVKTMKICSLHFESQIADIDASLDTESRSEGAE